MRNKNLIISLIITFSIICLLLITLMTNIMNGNINLSRFRFNSKVSNILIYDEVYENVFTTLNINSDASNIYVMNSNIDKVRVVIYGDKDKLNVNTDNSELYIKSEAKKCFGFCFNTLLAKIEIYLPVNYEKDIIINNKYGDIEIESFIKADVNIRTNYGDVLVKKINNITIDADYGDIDVNSANEIIIDSALGDINIDEVSGYLDISCDYGDIKIKNITISKNSKIDSALGDINIGNTNEIYIDAKTSLGDIKINNNSRLSDTVLTIKNACGDIRINN